MSMITWRDFSFMSLPRGAAEGENKFSMNLYLAERGDATIKTNTDLVEKANWLSDPSYPNFKNTRVTQDKQMYLDMSDRMLDRFNVQTTILQCMEELDLDAMAYPTSNTPPEKLGSPNEGDGRRGRTSSSSLGRQDGSPRSRRGSRRREGRRGQSRHEARRADAGALARRHRLRGTAVRRADVAEDRIRVRSGDSSPLAARGVRPAAGMSTNGTASSQ